MGTQWGSHFFLVFIYTKMDIHFPIQGRVKDLQTQSTHGLWLSQMTKGGVVVL